MLWPTWLIWPMWRKFKKETFLVNFQNNVLCLILPWINRGIRLPSLRFVLSMRMQRCQTLLALPTTMFISHAFDTSSVTFKGLAFLTKLKSFRSYACILYEVANNKPNESPHTVQNLHFLSKNSTLISRENCRFFLGEKLVKMLWFWTF